MGDKLKIDDLMFEAVYHDAWASEAPMYTRAHAEKLATEVLRANDDVGFEEKREALFKVGILSNYRRSITLKGKRFRLPLSYRNKKGKVEQLSIGVEGPAGEIGSDGHEK